MKHYRLYFILLCITAIFSSCDDNIECFENKVYINSAKVGTILVSTNSTEDRTIEAAIAKPASQEIKITYKAEMSLVDTYNKSYNAKAMALPSDYYEILQPTATIAAGSVYSTSVTVHFKDISKLSRDTIYVLPVTINNANISMLESARTTYFVLKGSALINVVADMEKNYLHIDNWVKPEVVTNMTALTMEALIRARNFDRLINTVMGIEGYFLIRLGDAGFPSNQIQLATSSGNLPGSDSSKGLPTNQWIHIALTYDSTTGAIKIYVNGKLQSEGTKSLGKITLARNGTNGFYIGRSYEDGRYLAGEFSECRIWNKALTEEDINSQYHFYQVDPASEGLVAYWKCNEGQGLVVKDQTGNGNDLTAKNIITWTSVNLPAAKK